MERQTRTFQQVMVTLLKQYQFRDKGETVAYGLSVSGAYALRKLAEAGPLTMTSLSRDLTLAVSTTTRVVDRLVGRKLVRREQDPGDRRIWRAALTARGRALWARLEAELLDIDREILRTLTPRERDALIRAMAQLSYRTAEWRARRGGERGPGGAARSHRPTMPA